MLRNLEVLAVDRNCLTKLPETVADLAALTCLNVRQNKLTSLPCLGPLKALKTLCASTNDLGCCPEGLEELVSLEELFLNGNR